MTYPTIIDISYCQPNAVMNWPRLKELGIGVIIRMGQNVYEDALFRTHYANAVKYGVPFGIYWFFQPNYSAALQVEAFLKIYNSLPIKPVAIYLDVENISYTDTNGKKINILPPSVERHTQWLDLWLTTVEKATGNIPGVYTRADYWNNWVIKNEKWSHFPLWIACWTIYSANVRLPRDWNEWRIWQHEGGTGRQDGVTGPVDKNYFNGTVDGMVAYFNAAVIPEPPSPPEPPAPEEPPAPTNDSSKLDRLLSLAQAIFDLLKKFFEWVMKFQA